MNLLVLDNYDSFTYNLVQYLEEISSATIEVHRNDKVSLDEVARFDAVILSPGPGLPKDAGIMPDLISRYAATIPIFGVCLGLQAIGEAFGASLKNLSKVYHGLSTDILLTDEDDLIFQNVPRKFQAGRYHSWVVNKADLPSELVITAEDENGQIMALKHRSFPCHAVQFHPESIMTPHGKKMLNNFLELLVVNFQAEQFQKN